MAGSKVFEQLDVAADQIVDVAKKLLHEGNVRRVLIRNRDGKTLVDIPVTAGIFGALLAPAFAALGTIAAVASGLKIVVERTEPGEVARAAEEQHPH